jgi:spore coat polysaccharide biosynthesis protein SpsF
MTQLKTIAIIQARMTSSRLPGKVLLEIGGEPMLTHVVRRTRAARRVQEVVVATTTDPSDDVLVEFCRGRGFPFYRGSLQDVLDRYYQAARNFGADVIVRVTADCPLIDPGLIDDVVEALLEGVQLGEPDSISQPEFHWDFVANRLPPPWKRTYPIGLDTEACTFAALERVWKEADQPHQREHVMPYLYEQKGRFRVRLLNYAQDLGALRWTVDTPPDLELVRQIFARFPGREDFSWLDVLTIFEHEPELAQINAGVRHKRVTEVDQRGSGKEQ